MKKQTKLQKKAWLENRTLGTLAFAEQAVRYIESTAKEQEVEIHPQLGNLIRILFLIKREILKEQRDRKAKREGLDVAPQNGHHATSCSTQAIEQDFLI